MSSDNLLRNGLLSEGYRPFRGNESIQLPAGWLPWWISHRKDEPDWKNQLPEFKPTETGRGQNLEVVQRLETPWATHTGGLLQQVAAASGSHYQLTAECQAWSSESEKPESLVEPSDVNVQIGVDPTGGLDPGSPLIVWSEPAEPLGRWRKLRLKVDAQASIMTVYLKSAPSRPKRQQAVLWRGAHLEQHGHGELPVSIIGPGDTHITLTPDQPRPGDAVIATISSSRNHAYIDLLVRKPDRELAAADFQGVSQEEGRYIWRYEFTISDPGLYEIRFAGDQGARLLAQQLLRVKARDLPAEAAKQAPSGRPRLDYHRVYVLLPPTADSKWLVAAARGSFDRRLTIGFSADDAGVGELTRRHVLAVNPHHWPGTMTAAWFHQHYPGTRFTAVVANSPADLENWLRNWVDEE
jgi:hypothetical protein